MFVKSIYMLIFKYFFVWRGIVSQVIMRIWSIHVWEKTFIEIAKFCKWCYNLSSDSSILNPQSTLIWSDISKIDPKDKLLIFFKKNVFPIYSNIFINENSLQNIFVNTASAPHHENYKILVFKIINIISKNIITIWIWYTISSQFM